MVGLPFTFAGKFYFGWLPGLLSAQRHRNRSLSRYSRKIGRNGLFYANFSTVNEGEATQPRVAHSPWAMTTPGDVSQADLAQVSHLAAGGSARVVR